MNKKSLGALNKKESIIDDNGDINQTILAIDVRVSGNEGGRKISGGYINVNERKMFLTEFIDNDHLSSLESFIIQMNHSAKNESTFYVLISMPSQNKDPLLYDKLHDLLKLS